jgi:hypothetical protein
VVDGVLPGLDRLQVGGVVVARVAVLVVDVPASGDGSVSRGVDHSVEGDLLLGDPVPADVVAAADVAPEGDAVVDDRLAGGRGRSWHE